MYFLYKNEYRIFKTVEITIIRELRKEKNRGNEPIWVIKHAYMEVSQGNSLYHYLKQTMPFFFYKNRERESKIGPVWRSVSV
jgi:hypothetical protein